jgi:hypothetical protein
MIRSGLCCYVAFVLVSCSPNPERVFKKMHDAACSGDVAGFFAHVDKTALKSWIAQRTREKLASEGASATEQSMVDMVADRGFAEMTQVWEDDIKRNKAGDLCKGKFEWADNPGGKVAWTTPTGKLKTAYFEPAGDTFLMVGID